MKRSLRSSMDVFKLTLFAGIASVLMPLGGLAQTTKPLHSFQGYYELVGRSDGDKPELVDDIIELRVAPVIGLKLDSCESGEGWLKYDTVQNNQPVLIGRLGRERLFCSIFNDRPDGQIFGCIVSVKDSEEKPGRLFLWPVAELDNDLNMVGICGR